MLDKASLLVSEQGAELVAVLFGLADLIHDFPPVFRDQSTPRNHRNSRKVVPLNENDDHVPGGGVA